MLSATRIYRIAPLNTVPEMNLTELKCQFSCVYRSVLSERSGSLVYLVKGEVPVLLVNSSVS